MFKKAMRRIVVLWCLYGLAKAAILVNPLVVKLGAVVTTALELRDDKPSFTFAGWMTVIIAVGATFLAGTAVHAITRWLFGEK